MFSMKMSHFLTNNRRTTLFYLFVFCCLSLYVTYFSLRESPHVKTFVREVLPLFPGLGPPETWHTRKHNFLEVENTRYGGLLVNGTNCKIPQFNPWETSVIPFVHQAEWVEDCRKIHFRWTYRDRMELVFNATMMEEDGYKFDKVSCCYKGISRVEQSLDKYDINADNLIKYSDCAKIISVRTLISKEEFIMVECVGTFYNTVYRGFHAFAQTNRSEETVRKMKFWRDKSDIEKSSELPPNILIVGTDTTSRLNFRRNMIKSLDALENMGAIEMLGYAKRENSRPVMTPFLMGYSLSEVETSCHTSRERNFTNFDPCPLIWDRFDAANYLTAYSEDWPDLALFNYLTVGFVKQPVDYYLRTLMNAAHDYGLPFPVNQFIRLSTQWCVGHQTNDEVLVDYIESVLELSHTHQSPVFSISWSNTYPHTVDHNNLQLIDSTYAEFLQRINTKGYLNNTILVFCSDHGQRYGPLRETLTGWYEDKLPNMWILLPDKIKREFPEWQEALEVNSRRVSSPYTMYSTLNFLLDKFSNTSAPKELINPETGDKMPRKYPQHFLTPLPDSNSCEDVGVPEVYCPCYPLIKLELDEPLLFEAGSLALTHLNPTLPSECAPLSIEKLRGGSRMEKRSRIEEPIDIYVIGFEASPGQILLEAQINYFPSIGKFSNISSIQRANKINQEHVECIQHLKNSSIELFCYCQKL